MGYQNDPYSIPGCVYGHSKGTLKFGKHIGIQSPAKIPPIFSTNSITDMTMMVEDNVAKKHIEYLVNDISEFEIIGGAGDFVNMKITLPGGKIFDSLIVKSLHVELFDTACNWNKQENWTKTDKDLANEAYVRHEEEEYNKWYGDIPSVDPYTVNAGSRVVFRRNNRWTLVKKVKLDCDKCGHYDWNWIVKNKGEIQIWNCKDKSFWKHIVLLKNWPNKEEAMHKFSESIFSGLTTPKTEV